MTELDSAIRNAIERAGAHDAAARQRIYDAARQAFEKGIANHPELEADAAQAQRQRLDATVRRIEAEQTGADAEASSAGGAPRVSAEDEPDVSGTARQPAAPPPEAFEIVSVEPDRGETSPGGTVPFPDIGADRAAGATATSADPVPEIEPRGDDFRASDVADPEAGETVPARRPAEAETPAKDRSKAAPGETAGSDRREKKRRARRGRAFSAVFLLVSLFVFVALGLWLLDVTGLVDPSASAGGGSFSKFDAGRNGGSPDLFTDEGASPAWTPIFAPGAADGLQAGSAAKTTPVDSERGKAVRLVSNTPEANGDIRITVPAAILERMAGTKAILALTMRGVAGQSGRIAIECDFSSMGGCNRRRFAVNPEMTDVVIGIDETNATAPGQPGYLLINTDIEGKGRPVDLFAISLRNTGRTVQ